MTEWLWHLLDWWEKRLLRSPSHVYWVDHRDLMATPSYFWWHYDLPQRIPDLKPGESVIVVFDKEDKR